jgi:hypothetical protein
MGDLWYTIRSSRLAPESFFLFFFFGFFVLYEASTYIYNNVSSSHILFMTRSHKRENADV